MRKITIVLILFALLLTACGSLGAKAKDKSKTEDTQPAIVFQRSGGFAGVSEQWSIYASGKIINQNGEELSVEPAKVTALLEAIQTAGFYDLKASSSIGGISNCKDCFTYQLTVNGGEKANTLSFQEGSKDIPDAFWNIIQQINELVAKPATQ
jgi:hypothetical protein